MGEQRLGLKEAGRLLGLSANGVRARAAAGKLRHEIDNARKWWVFLDPEAIANDGLKLRVPAPSNSTSNLKPQTSDFEPERRALQGHIATLTAALSAANAEIDHLRLAAGEAARLNAAFAALEARHEAAGAEIASLRDKVGTLDAERQRLVADLLARLPALPPPVAAERVGWLRRLFGKGKG